MKARIIVDKKTKARINAEVKQEYERQGSEIARRNIKLMCVALNERFGFGKKRLMELVEHIGELSKERNDDEVFWAHIDRYLESIGLDFPREDYEQMDE